MTIAGRVTSVQIFENRSNLFIIHVLHDEFSGHFDCKIEDIRLDGEPTDRASDIAGFVESRHVTAVLHSPDYSTTGTGSTKCERIELLTVRE